VLRDPLQNRDAAFTHAERHALGIEGLLPPAVLTIAQQTEMELEHIFSKQDRLEQYIGLIALLDRNEALFYRLLVENLERLIPIIYTPTVGLACQQFSHIFRRPRGLFLCPADRGQLAKRLRNFRQRDIRLIVATDNERILGLGDQGAGGMAIPIGKLMLYSAGAGIHPTFCLPVSLDVGTDNGTLLEDPQYLGYRGRRLRGADYDSFIEEFVQAVRTVFPRAILQWEDFKKGNAFTLLERYVGRLPSFNDDIQGTSAVALSGIFSGMNLLKGRLSDQRVLLAGAGAAGVGIGRLLRLALRQEGVPESQAKRCLIYFDSGGLVTKQRANLEPHKRDFALGLEECRDFGLNPNESGSLVEVIRKTRATVLIGTTGQPGDFTPACIRAMADGTARPMIFPLSNPTSKAECTPSEALFHSDGRALIATGSPFDPVVFKGKTHVIGQCNNVFIFPGVGLGALISESTRVSEAMFLAAARTLARFTAEHGSCQSEALYPVVSHLREVSRRIAFEVARTAREEGIGRTLDDKELDAEIKAFFWNPDYAPQINGGASIAADQNSI